MRGAAISADAERRPIRGPIRTAVIANLGCKVNRAEMGSSRPTPLLARDRGRRFDAVDPAARDRVIGRILALTPPPPSPGALAHAD